MGDNKQGGHQALYRKYRSKKLSEIVGQEHITTTLQNALKKGTVNHAYLFTGPRGTGKTSIARILAHELNNLPYETKQHLDIIEIDAASNRRIEDIRDLREKVNIAPINAKYKVYIIDEVHMLTTESFNALLKTLEEPPEHVIFILATTEIQKLPATILSRTQKHSFRLVPINKVSKHLRHISDQENINIDDDALDILAEHGGGSFRDSISLLDQVSMSSEHVTVEYLNLLLGLAPEKYLDKLLGHIKAGDWSSIKSTLNDLEERGLTANMIAEQLTKYLSKLIYSSPDRQILNILNNLMEVNGAYYPKLKLDSVLIEAAMENMTSEQSPQQSTKNKSAEPKATTQETIPQVIRPKVEDGAPVEVKAEENIEAQKSSTEPKNSITGDITQIWPKILTTVKEKNNSLYTLLKSSEPALVDDTLTLKVRFPFHKKKLDDHKYISIICEAFEEITGSAPEVITEVNSSVKPPLIKPVDSAHASLISNVQDIMGGGEVINA